MSQLPLEKLDPPKRILKRAQYEALEFSLLDGDVLVRNESHLDPADHEYLVTVVDGAPIACECPADATYDEPCKHRVAVAIRPRILEIATKAKLLADGGPTVTEERQPDSGGESETEQCDCEKLREGFPCWECVRTGRREMPDITR
jgi:hypothetical protein